MVVLATCHQILHTPDIRKSIGPRSLTDEMTGGPVNLFYATMFKITKIRWRSGKSQKVFPMSDTLDAGGHIYQRDWLFKWIKTLCIEYILWRLLTIKSMFDVANMLKRLTVKDVPINDCGFINIQAYSFNMFWNKGSTQSLVVSCMYWVVSQYPLEFQAIVRSFYSNLEIAFSETYQHFLLPALFPWFLIPRLSSYETQTLYVQTIHQGSYTPLDTQSSTSPQAHHPLKYN